MKRLHGELITGIVLSIVTIIFLGVVSYLWYGKTFMPNPLNGRVSTVTKTPSVSQTVTDSPLSPAASTSGVIEHDLTQQTGAKRSTKCTSDTDCMGRFVYCSTSPTKFCQTTCQNGSCQYSEKKKDELQ